MSVAGGGGGRPLSHRVSFLFRRSEGAGHCAGVNAVALSADEQRLWTGSRDSVIACWDATAAPRPPLLHEHVGHVDWVNDLALVGDVLVSCSNDRTLRVWQPDSPGPALGCLTGHSDYVTGVAASAASGTLASGGLRGEVLLWDLEALRRVMTGAASDDTFGATPADAPRGSIYAIGMNEAGSLVATGSTEALVSLIDVRSGQTAMQLKGHSDNIRALQLDAEGRLLLTGSADHTMRLWDLGQQRCVQTLAVHTDSVWALAAGAGFATVYSGGRDGCIYKTRLATRVSELLACEQQPVLRLAVAADERSLWAATTSPSVHKWQVEAREPPALALPVSPRSPAPAGGGPAPIAGSFFHASPSVAARARLAFDLHGTRPTAQQLQPLAATPGMPPIQHAAVLTDRRHVLTQDAEGRVQMWDVTAGAVVRDFGQRELKDVERQLFEPSQSVSAWFAPEVKLGSLAGSMEAPACFGAEIYAQDLGDVEAPIDLKVNFGEQMLVALFRQWASTQQQQQQQQQQQSPTAGQRGSTQQQRQPAAAPAAAAAAPAAGEAASAAGAAAQQQQVDEDSSMADEDEDSAAGPAEPAAPSSRFVFEGPLATVVMVAPVGGSSAGGAGSIPWRCAIDSFTGEEEVPHWVADCVLHGQFPVSRELKMAFQLLPLPGSGLPSLLQSRLNAPRVLRVNKAADYVRRKMEEHGIQLREEPLFWDPAKAERWQAEAGAAQHDPGAAAGVHQLQPVGGGASGGAGQPAAILITCKGHTVPWDFSLAAVRQWIWRRSDDLVLHYSVRDERTPLRLPAIRPPS